MFGNALESSGRIPNALEASRGIYYVLEGSGML